MTRRVRSDEACVLRRVRSHYHYKRSAKGGACHQCWSCSRQQQRSLARAHVYTYTRIGTRHPHIRTSGLQPCSSLIRVSASLLSFDLCRRKLSAVYTFVLNPENLDQPDKQQQQQDQDHTSKQHIPQQLHPEHDIIITSMEGTDDEVAVAVSRDTPTDACHQATAGESSKQQQQQPEGIPDSGIPLAGASHVKAKKPRRRRGGKGRWKPYHALSLKEKIAQEEKEERIAVGKRERLFSRGKPMAPYNTTQFLVEDHEMRTMLPDSGDLVSGTAAHQRQCTGGFSPRCGAIGQSGSEMGGNTTDSASYSGAEDDEMERQFDADYDYVNMERISNMTKDEVAREYMHLEKINGKLADRVSLLQLENDKLKQLLKDHNISYEDVLPKIRRHSGTSVSEAGDGTRKGLDETVVDNK
uniref:Uncharacterized protein n=1 Tax=Setaria digitata TaxID=48799 RepID=A0A915PPI2_9BILA